METLSITFPLSPSLTSKPCRSSKSFSTSISLRMSNCSNSQLPLLRNNLNSRSNLLSLSSASSSSSSMASVVQANAFPTAGGLNEELETSSSGVVGQNDLLIIGPGVLGRLVAQQWREDYPGCQVYGQTMTTDHHDELIQMGIHACLKGTRPFHQFPYVIFSAPPSRSPDYVAELRDAASSWNGEGSFVFTSSSAVYDCADNGCCDEDTPLVPMGRSPRTDVLLKAENVVLDCGGCILRLGGLYKADRGAHMYWLKQVTSELRPDHIVNLIHYEDAASLAVAILKNNFRGRVFLGCDNHPLSREQIMQLVNKSGKFDKKFEGFTGADGPLGKRLNNSKSHGEIGWQPKYSSFAEFLEAM